MDVERYCVINIDLLQFADFYTALLSVWITFVSLANPPLKLKNSIHMLGAILIALVVESDRTALWAFAAPTAIGLLVLTIAWVLLHLIVRTHSDTNKLVRR